MSVSKVSGKLAFAILMTLTLGLGGCAVATGEEAEGVGEKTQQATSDTAADDGTPSNIETGKVSADDNSGNDNEPQPFPWIKSGSISRQQHPLPQTRIHPE